MTSSSRQRRPALSVRQPWAELILSGRKTIEIRSWVASYRGSIWLHAPKTVSDDAAHLFGFTELATGCYVGSVLICAIVSLDRERWESWKQKHLDSGPYRPGHFAWVLASANRLSSLIPGPGKRGLFYPEEETLSLLERADVP